MSKIITLWGSPNSGKTTTSIKIAKELSKKNSTLLVFLDNSIPTLPAVFTFINEDRKSIGELLSSPVISQEDILNKCISTSIDNLALLSYLSIENEYTYSDYIDERILDFIVLLKHLVDYVVIDCNSFLAKCRVSKIALLKSDITIRTMGASAKCISFFDSQMPLINDSEYRKESHFKILSNYKPYHPIDVASSYYKGIDFYLPYIKELELQSLECNLLEKLKDKESNAYNNYLEKLVDKILEV